MEKGYKIIVITCLIITIAAVTGIFIQSITQSRNRQTGEVNTHLLPEIEDLQEKIRLGFEEVDKRFITIEGSLKAIPGEISGVRSAVSRIIENFDSSTANNRIIIETLTDSGKRLSKLEESLRDIEIRSGEIDSLTGFIEESCKKITEANSNR